MDKIQKEKSEGLSWGYLGEAMKEKAEDLRRHGCFDNEELLAVERNNALRLFPRLHNKS